MKTKIVNTDLPAMRKCQLEDLKVFGLQRLKINEWPDNDLDSLITPTDTTFRFIIATRSRFPIVNIGLKVEGGELVFDVKPIHSVVFPEKAELIPDYISSHPTVNVAGNTTMSFLVKGEIPKDFQPGKYELKISAESDSHLPSYRTMWMEVFATPAQSSSQETESIINFWPHWTPLCLHYGIDMWSESFWDLAGLYLAEMAKGGNNVITVAITNDPFRYPLPEIYYHNHEMPCLIQWNRKQDKWSFDYSRYDRYIELNFKHGINREIECHSLLPCKQQLPVLTYYDLDTDRYVEQQTTYDAPDYKNAWGAFLTDFIRHNRKRGWDKLLTICPYDEPADLVTFRAVALMVKKYAPGIRITAAIQSDIAISLTDVIDIATVHLSQGYSSDNCEILRQNGVEVRWYNCCFPDWGNTLFSCPLADSYRIAWITEANNMSGYLRWSIFNWTDGIFNNPGFNWPTGDMYLLYPDKTGPLNSLRWEAYKAGREDINLVVRAMSSIPAHSKAHIRLCNLISTIGKHGNMELPDDIQDWKNELFACLGT